MKLLTTALTASVLLLCLFGSQAQADPSEYGIAEAEASLSSTQAGGHPDFTVKLALNTMSDGHLPATTRDVIAELPPGLIANPGAVPTCSTAQLLSIDVSDKSNAKGCPQSSQVGIIEIELFGDSGVVSFTEPLYNLAPRFGEPARLGFFAQVYPVILDTALRHEDDYGVNVLSENISSLVALLSATTKVWAVPADASHDAQRITPFEALNNASVPETPNGKRSAGLIPIPYMHNPSRCGVPLGVGFEVIPYISEAFADQAIAPLPSMVGCGLVDFEPTLDLAAPTSSNAETGAGLDFELSFPTEGFESPILFGGSPARRAEVTIPEGVTINPSVGEGLSACSPADLKRETLSSAPGAGCPNASKFGSLSASSPLIDQDVPGSIYLATQDDPATSSPGAENPFDSLIALYFVLKNPSLGVMSKLAVKVEPDPRTGQLIATLEDIPQLPISHFSAHLRTGERAALITPSTCGTYSTQAKLYPWSDPSASKTLTASFKVSAGVGGGPCPTGGVPPFKPRFQAGSQNNEAGAFSPFDMRLLRADGEQDMTRFSSVLPPGVLGSLAGVGRCADAAIEAAKAKSARSEIASPSCPDSSLIGHTLAGAGVGSALTYVPGKLYLAGPYNGDPLSVVSITPALAGPFDAGTVVVRVALNLNSRTSEIEVDGQSSDPIPHILKGIVLKVRDLRVYVDRPNFTLNPTSCDPSSAKATLFGSFVDVFDPADDIGVDLSSRYQAANCLNLGFKPKLNLNLKGGTKRGGHPGLKALYKPRKGDANVEGLVVRLPRSAFLDQAHIRTICTRVQFAADACPKAAQYGYVKAWTPLLDEPLQGPVWLRSSNHKLPDLVFDLHGLVDVEVATRIDSAQGGIRARVEEAPDAPLTKVELKMQGGQKGLIINSRSLCGSTSKANVEFSGHNGKQFSANPVVRPQCKRRKRAKRSAHGRASRARVAQGSASG